MDMMIKQTFKTLTHLLPRQAHRIGIAFSLLLASLPLQAKVLDGIAMVINEEPVLVSEVRQTAMALRGIPKFAKLPPRDLWREAMENLTLKTIQLQRAKALGMSIDDAAVNRAVAKIAEQNRLSMEKFQIALAREGFNYEEFRENIRNQILISELKKRYSSLNDKTDESKIEDIVTNYFPQLTKGTSYQYSEILIKAPQGTPLQQLKQTRQQAWNIRNQLINGAAPESFNAVLKDSSTDSISRSIGRQLAQLDVGQISDIIHDQDGFHIIKLNGKNSQQQLNLPDEMQVRHILIKTSKDLSDEQALAKISNIRQRILAGEKFSKLAIENSQDTGSAQQGGDLGWSSPDTYVPEFAARMRSQPIHTLSEPFKTKFGWHILEVTGHREVHKNTHDIIRAQARSVLANSQKSGDEGYDNWLRELRKNARIEYRAAR